MQVPDYTFRPLTENESLRDNEVEVTEAQMLRIKDIMREREARNAKLAIRPRMSKGSRRRR